MEISKFADLTSRIEECISTYERSSISTTKYSIDLANEESLQIKFYPNNLAHILGVDTSYLRSTGIYTGSSYEVLKEVTQNPMKLYNNIKANVISPKNVFSDYIEDKLDNFRKIYDIRFFDIDFIVEYKKERNYSPDEELDNGYYFGYAIGDYTYVVGYTRNSNSHEYSPHTSVHLKKYSQEEKEYLQRLFKNQPVTIPIFMRKNTIREDGFIDKKQFWFQNRDKASRLRTVKRYAENYDGICNTISDHIYIIDKQANLLDGQDIDGKLVEYVSSKIKERKIIDKRSVDTKFGDISEEMLQLIGAHNDSIVNFSSAEQTSTHSYADLIQRLEEAKAELIEKSALVESLKKQNEELISKNAVLKDENEEYQKNQEAAVKILTQNKK